MASAPLYCEMHSQCSHNAVHYRVDFMSRKKRKTKSAVITIRLDPRIKAAAQLAAERDRRSVTNFIELLILKHCERTGINPPK
jgi:hypothetical protein